MPVGKKAWGGITVEVYRKIEKCLRSTNLTQALIADRFGVSRETVREVNKKEKARKGGRTIPETFWDRSLHC
jgi:DNA invertase Pin-like site-specific DNA recombinase